MTKPSSLAALWMLQPKCLPVLNQAEISLMLCGHTHRYQLIEPNNAVKFPILINSFNTSLKMDADQQKITVQRKDTKGEEVSKYLIMK